MAGGLEIIKAGKIESLIVDNISLGVPSSAECTIKATKSGIPNIDNEIENTTLGYVIESTEAKAGFSGLKVNIPQEKYDQLLLIKNGALAVPVILRTANSTFKSESLTITGADVLALSSKDSSVSLTMEGKFFEGSVNS